MNNPEQKEHWSPFRFSVDSDGNTSSTATGTPEAIRRNQMPAPEKEPYEIQEATW